MYQDYVSVMSVNSHYGSVNSHYRIVTLSGTMGLWLLRHVAPVSIEVVQALSVYVARALMLS